MHSPRLFESCNNNVRFHCAGWSVPVFELGGCTKDHTNTWLGIIWMFVCPFAPATTTVIAGYILWWYCPLSMASCLSSLPVDNKPCTTISLNTFPSKRSIYTKTGLLIVGTWMATISSSRWLAPPPVLICPKTNFNVCGVVIFFIT